MPLNPQSVKERSQPWGSVCIDRHHRFPMPAEMGWKVGARVYFSLTEPDRGLRVSIKPGPLLKGRLFSGRIRRSGFAPLSQVRKKAARRPS